MKFRGRAAAAPRIESLDNGTSDRYGKQSLAITEESIMSRPVTIFSTAVALTLLTACGEGASIQFSEQYRYGETLPTAASALRNPETSAGDSPGGSPNAELMGALAAQANATNVIVTFEDVSATVNATYSGTPESNGVPAHSSAHGSTGGRLTAYFNAASGPRADLSLTFAGAQLHNPSDNPNDDGEVDVLESLELAHVPVDVFSEQYNPGITITPAEWHSDAFEHIHAREFARTARGLCDQLFDCNDTTMPPIHIRMNGEDWREAEGAGTIYHGPERGLGAARIHVDDFGNPGMTTDPNAGGILHPNGHGRGYGFDIYVRSGNTSYPDTTPDS